MPKAKKTDIIDVSSLKKGDILIPVMGVTGVGKSTFINTAVRMTVTNVNHDVNTRKQPIQPVIFPYKTGRVVFLDTPGFNDTWRDDAETLRRIAIWLQHSCEVGVTLAGVIYLHEISQTRLVTTGGSLTMFDVMYRPESQNVVLATTKWKQPETKAERERERNLCQYWTGPHMPRFANTYDSAWQIVDLILQKKPLDTHEFKAACAALLERLPKTKTSTAWGAITALFGRNRT